jgi:hypothetical protein
MARERNLRRLPFDGSVTPSFNKEVTMTDTDRVQLSELPGEIASLTGGRSPKYRTLYNAAVDARIPAKRGDNGRWTVSRRDVPQIVEILRQAAA